MNRHGWSQNQLAAEIGADSGKVNRWLHATQRPSLRWANVLHAKLGIEPAAWEATPRRPIVLHTGTDA
jgi:ribosome-binding protein aMBF1 (putative translation factor)